MFVRISFLILSLIVYSIYAQSPLKLADALREASVNNPSLKSEQNNVPIAESDFKKSKLNQNPIFNIQYLQLMPSSMYYDRNHGAFNSVNSQDWYQLTKKFQVFGQRKNKIELAKLNTSIANSNFEETRRQVYLNVSLKWIDAWKSLAYRSIAIKAADYLDEYLKENFDSLRGISSMKEEEILRFKILDDQYDLERSKAELSYENLIQELKLLVGTDREFDIDLNDTIESVKITTSLDSLFLLARDNRSDIKGLKIVAEYSSRNIQFQKSLSIPPPEAGLLWNPQNTIPYAGIFFTQTLPFFDRNQTEVQKSKLQSEMAEIDFQNSITKLKSEVKMFYHDYVKKKEMVTKFKISLNDSERLLRMVRIAYLLKKQSMVDLWEAEQTWIQTYTIYYEAFADYRKSYINLLYQLNLLSEIN
jgi:outer membrane protein, heavy metal efflux system